MASQKAEGKKVKTYYILYYKLFTNKMGIPPFFILMLFLSLFHFQETKINENIFGNLFSDYYR